MTPDHPALQQTGDGCTQHRKQFSSRRSKEQVIQSRDAQTRRRAELDLLVPNVRPVADHLAGVLNVFSHKLTRRKSFPIS